MCGRFYVLLSGGLELRDDWKFSLATAQHPRAGGRSVCALGYKRPSVRSMAQAGPWAGGLCAAVPLSQVALGILANSPRGSPTRPCSGNRQGGLSQQRAVSGPVDLPLNSL